MGSNPTLSASFVSRVAAGQPDPPGFAGFEVSPSVSASFPYLTALASLIPPMGRPDRPTRSRALGGASHRNGVAASPALQPQDKAIAPKLL